MSEPTFATYVQKGSSFRTWRRLGCSFINPSACLPAVGACLLLGLGEGVEEVFTHSLVMEGMICLCV